jgi:hypothetical protein
MLVLWREENRKTRRKTLEARERINNKLNSYMTLHFQEPNSGHNGEGPPGELPFQAKLSGMIGRYFNKLNSP